MKEIELITRPYIPGSDDPYIYSSWSKYAWYSPTKPHTFSKPAFFKAKIAEIKNCLENGETRIACFKDDPNMLIGYVNSLNGSLQWLCIKKDYRALPEIEALLKRSIQPYLKTNQEGVATHE